MTLLVMFSSWDKRLVICLAEDPFGFKHLRFHVRPLPGTSPERQASQDLSSSHVHLAPDAKPDPKFLTSTYINYTGSYSMIVLPCYHACRHSNPQEKANRRFSTCPRG